MDEPWKATSTKKIMEKPHVRYILLTLNIRHHLTSDMKQFYLPLLSVEHFLCGHCCCEVQNQFRIQYFSPFVMIKICEFTEFCKYFTQTEASFRWIEIWRSGMMTIYDCNFWYKKWNRNMTIRHDDDLWLTFS